MKAKDLIKQLDPDYVECNDCHRLMHIDDICYLNTWDEEKRKLWIICKDRTDCIDSCKDIKYVE